MIASSDDLIVASRQALGDLWLPWCVERHQPDRILPIDWHPERISDAEQLQVRALDDPVRRSALTDNKGQDSLKLIEQLAREYARRACRGHIVVAPSGSANPLTWPRAFRLPEGPMLHEASHRACALYESGVDGFEMRAILGSLFGGWLAYKNRALRVPTP